MTTRFVFWPISGKQRKIIYRPYLGKHQQKIEAQKRAQKIIEQNEIRRPPREHSLEYYERRELFLHNLAWQQEENEQHMKALDMFKYDQCEFSDEEDPLGTENSNLDEQNDWPITLDSFPVKRKSANHQRIVHIAPEISSTSTPEVPEQRTPFDFASLDLWKEILGSLSPLDKLSFAGSCKSARRITFAVIAEVAINPTCNTEEALQRILIFLKKCPRLIALDLSKVPQMNDKLIDLLSPKLQLLNLRGCNISPKAFDTLSQLPLHFLDVSENNSFRRQPIKFPPTLQYLQLDFCINMKNSALKVLPKGLKSISMQHCVSISEGKITELQKQYTVITEYT